MTFGRIVVFLRLRWAGLILKAVILNAGALGLWANIYVQFRVCNLTETMNISQDSADLREHEASLQQIGEVVGFVPLRYRNGRDIKLSGLIIVSYQLA